MITRKLAMATMGFAAVAILGNVTAQTDVAPSSGGNARAPRVRSTVATTVPTGSGVNFGDPLPNLTAAEFADFAEGREDFQEVDTAASGLGPVFNNVSCVACHSVPAIGGSSAILEKRFGRFANGHFDPLASEGGSLLQLSAIDPQAQEGVPSTANVIAQPIM